MVAPLTHPRAPTQGYPHGGACAERLACDNEVVALPRDSQLGPSMRIVELPARLQAELETCERHRTRLYVTEEGDGGGTESVTVSESQRACLLRKKR